MANLPPEKHTRILRKGNKDKDEPQYPIWIKHYFWLAVGFLWGIVIILLWQEVL